MQNPNRPLRAQPLSATGRLAEWAKRVVSNGVAVVALSVAVAVLSVAVLVLFNSVQGGRNITDCRSRISSQVQGVESDLNVQVAKGLLALGNGDKEAREAATTQAGKIIVVLDKVNPIRENSVDLCNGNSGFVLDVPAYDASDK